ncbi:hypothetical protein PHYSODRAFT_353855 [Phytophthora sojae]|uniref:RxLR effector protein n=1 Tax=Phytophthora sojae (strain P6497) TaxID=1094619 RepID=G4YUZ2_PHYSP|nr:hypothetical protein PHYSODRAFT_353855 [Phytophthora sojae]EGZ23662.1 hypothetical protein PHYSODRAFT_353855 [Phytophthora sojae]|eukprot:XP_009518950.1 hypothetical protein PHYSODRAFT_353855 [Phytophthora sojae]
MRGGILTLLLVALAVLAAVGMAETAEPQEVAVDVDSDLIVEEETLEAQPETGAQPDEADAVPVQEIDPRLTPEAIEKVFSKMSTKCLKQVQENPTDPTKVSDRCRAEVARRIQRYLERLDKEEKGETEEKKTEKPKRRSRKGKKQSRAQREAAAAQKKEEQYQQTLQTILGFVATVVAIIAGAMFYINRKLKAAGMYFPDPDAKATCCN